MKGHNFSSVLIMIGLIISPLNIVYANIITLEKPLTAPVPAEYSLSGRWLYCVTRGSRENTETDLVMSRIDGTHSKVLYSVRGQIFSLTASFNPRYVTFTANTYNAYPMAYLLDLQTSHIRLLTPYRANNLGSSVSPDGEHFLFSSDLNGNFEIYHNVLDTPKLNNTKLDKNLVRLTDDPNADISPSFAPDGKSFIFVSDRKGHLQPQIYQYNFATKQTTWIDTKTNYASEPKFNPTGDKITLLTRSQGIVYNIKTKDSRRITNDSLYEAPTFSPDGNFVAYSTGKNLVVIPEHRIWQTAQPDERDKIPVMLILPKGITGTIRRPLWLP